MHEIQFEVVNNVTKEFFVIPEDGSAMYLKFETAFKIDESITLRTRRTKNEEGQVIQKEPMEVADVVNLQTGEEGRLIGNSVIKSELRNNYPSDSYVGKYFEFKQGEKRKSKDGNTYRAFKIVEIKLKSGANNETAGTKTSVKK
jgi:hypothetical protein